MLKLLFYPLLSYQITCSTLSSILKKTIHKALHEYIKLPTDVALKVSQILRYDM